MKNCFVQADYVYPYIDFLPETGNAWSCYLLCHVICLLFLIHDKAMVANNDLLRLQR